MEQQLITHSTQDWRNQWTGLVVARCSRSQSLYVDVVDTSNPVSTGMGARR